MKSPLTASGPRFPRILTGLVIGSAILGAFLAGYALRARHSPEPMEIGEGIRPAPAFSRPGPWGELEYQPIVLTPPEEILRERDFPRRSPHWVLSRGTAEDFARLMTDAGVPETARAAWMAPSVLRETREGLELTPTCGMVRALADSAREALYIALSVGPKNISDRWEFLARNLASFPGYGVSDATVRAVLDHSVRHGRFLFSYAMNCAVPEGATDAQKHALLKALSQQPSRIVRLHITPKVNLARRIEYWGAAGQIRKVRPLLESLNELPTGGAVDLSELLPRMPSELLHTYESQSKLPGPKGGQRNCYWTALNFFNEHPNADFVDAARAIAAVKRDYVPVAEPHFGDVAVFFKPNMDVVHMANYLADDFYFTKNGYNVLHPWVVNGGPILRQIFSFGLPEGDSITVRHFRRKGT